MNNKPSSVIPTISILYHSLNNCCQVRYNSRMRLSIDQVQKVAKLANLTLTPEEEEKFSDQLSKILGYVEELNAVNTDGVKPTFNVNSNENVLRPDTEESSLTQEEALQNAPNKKDSFFISKGVFKNE